MARGHWTSGKRRNPDVVEWSRVRLQLQSLFDGHDYRSGTVPALVSKRGLATAIGVSDRSVRRWLAGEDRPSEEHQRAIVAWMQDVRRRTQIFE